MSRRERQRRNRRNQAGPHRAVFLALGLVVTALLIGALSVVGYVIAIAASAPNLSDLKPISQGATSVVYASDGTTRLGFIQSDILRTPIASSQMPPALRQATVAIEDKRFYRHKGVDYEGIVRSAIKNVASHKAVQGGSTLTMQLIRNLYTDDRTKSFKRKIREAKLAQEMEDVHTGPPGKEWILTSYLNNVPYGTVGGQTAIGVQAASRIFFNKPAKNLTLSEAALLAGLPQAPSQYNPFLDKAAARSRRNEVLRSMAQQHYITAQQAAEAEASPLGVKPSDYYSKHREGYFFDYVKQELIKKYGSEEVRRGGLKVYTTIDLKLQKLARQAIANHLSTPGDPSSALVSIDPRNGHIVAMASSSKYGSSSFNLAAQSHRQPGSTFKVMVLMAALKQGVDPKSTTYESRVLNFIDPVSKAKIDVKTDDHVYRGRENLFEGLVHSDNTVYQQLDLDVGPDTVRQTAYDMGITSHLDAFPAEGLGGLTHGVSPLEMTRAYVTINTGGKRLKPVAITKVVKADGHVDTSFDRQDPKQVFTDGQTYEAIKAMEANVQRGTGTKAQIDCAAAGKTGTTSSFTDAWFDGFTTNLNTAVWVGYPNSTISMTNVAGYGEMFGGDAPAQIWHDFMQVAAHQIGDGCKEFPQPATPFQSAPFFGKYATTGAPGGGVDTQQKSGSQNGNGGQGTSTTPQQGATKGQGGGNGGGTTNGGNGGGNGGGTGTNNGGQGFDPQKYASPPQPPPGQAPGGSGGTAGGGTTAPGQR